jgi:hypothetical protein
MIEKPPKCANLAPSIASSSFAADWHWDSTAGGSVALASVGSSAVSFRP